MSLRPREYFIMESILNPATLKPLAGSKGLVWWPEVGVGYYPVEAGEAPYDDHYFAKYATMAETEQGRSITEARVNLVNDHWIGNVLDIGIGCGAFINSRNKDFTYAPTRGYDVNPAGQDWLKSRSLWLDPYEGDQSVDAASFWDVLEHIQDIPSIVRRVRHFVFVSIPIFTTMQHVRASKHFRRDEHFWYFTFQGIAAVFNHLGFETVHASRMECDLGREDIGTFVFKRRRGFGMWGKGGPNG